jgi:hypothetical protein
VGCWNDEAINKEFANEVFKRQRSGSFGIIAEILYRDSFFFFTPSLCYVKNVVSKYQNFTLRTFVVDNLQHRCSPTSFKIGTVMIPLLETKEGDVI